MTALPNLFSGHAPANYLDPYSDYSTEKMCNFLSNTQLVSKPGDIWEYTNLGLGLLGNLVGGWDAPGYEKTLEARVLKPLGMNSTYLVVPYAEQFRMAKGHNRERAITPFWNFDAAAAAGALKASLKDMKKYVRAYLRPPGNSAGQAIKESQRILASELCDKGSSAPSYSYAWPHSLCGAEGVAEFKQLYWYTGQTGGFTAFVAFNPEGNVGAVVLSNLSDLYPEDTNYQSEQNITFFGLRVMKQLMKSESAGSHSPKK